MKANPETNTKNWGGVRHYIGLVEEILQRVSQPKSDWPALSAEVSESPVFDTDSPVLGTLIQQAESLRTEDAADDAEDQLNAIEEWAAAYEGARARAAIEAANALLASGPDDLFIEGAAYNPFGGNGGLDSIGN